MDLKKKREIVCINCGKVGHIYKKCHLPIISFGLICIKLDGIDLSFLLQISKDIDNENALDSELEKCKSLLANVDRKYLRQNIKYLMINRRISLSIIEFIRGKYKLTDLDYLMNTIRYMTNKEKENILKYDFDENWNSLWNTKLSKKNGNFHNEYMDSKNKFNKLKEGYTVNVYGTKVFVKLENIIKYCENNYEETEWGFPKGRRDLNEEDIECAKREFEEETDFLTNEYKMLRMNSINELFMGSNKVRYRHKYYISQISTEREPEINQNNKIQLIEIGDIKWFTIEECLNKIRDYSVEKKSMISNFNFLIVNFIMSLKEQLY